MATITGTAGNDNLNGTSGDDVIDGAGGIDTINAGDGDDIVRLAGSTGHGDAVSLFDGGAGYDILDLTGWLKPLHDTYYGDEQYSLYQVNPADGSFDGVARISNFEEIHLSDAGNQLDIGTGGSPLKILSGAGADILVGGGEDDIFDTGAGDDQVIYWGGNDRATLGAGNDLYDVHHVITSPENVIVDGGAGIDTIKLSDLAASEDVSVDLVAKNAHAWQTQVSLSGFENITIDNSIGVSLAGYGMVGLDLPWHGFAAGDDGANTISISSIGDAVALGRGGDDIIVASGPVALTAYGGPGNDAISGGQGDDWIDGGGHYAGDTVPASPAGDGGDTLDGGSGNDHIWGNSEFAVQGAADGADLINAGFGMDYVNGNAGDDTIQGGEGTDRLYGGAGDDLIDGDDWSAHGGSMGNGDDHINGNKGNDSLHGGGGNDEILGGQGDDVIEGGLGFDTMSGNVGNDIFQFNGGAAAFSTTGPDAGRTDVITDFQHGQDQIQLFLPVSQVFHPGSAGDFPGAVALAHSVLTALPSDTWTEQVAAIQVGSDTYIFWDGGPGDPASAVRLLNTNAATMGLEDFYNGPLYWRSAI